MGYRYSKDVEVLVNQRLTLSGFSSWVSQTFPVGFFSNTDLIYFAWYTDSSDTSWTSYLSFDGDGTIAVGCYAPADAQLPQQRPSAVRHDPLNHFVELYDPTAAHTPDSWWDNADLASHSWNVNLTQEANAGIDVTYSLKAWRVRG